MMLRRGERPIRTRTASAPPGRAPRAVTGGIRLIAAAMATAAIHSATVPSKMTTRRCSRMPPATTAPSPISAARLRRWSRGPRRRRYRAGRARARSRGCGDFGVSAGSAATSPRSASDRPNRVPSRSSRATRTALEPRLSAAAPTNTATDRGAASPGAAVRPAVFSRSRRTARFGRRRPAGDACLPPAAVLPRQGTVRAAWPEPSARPA